jgi:hypothetical protein
MGTRLKLIDACQTFWQAVRQLSGDNGYERYLVHVITQRMVRAPTTAKMVGR